ncbi:heparan-alpha-glucosaminide N-acetyltransferase domain-containing protein [Labedella endophytica]|uniref:DUF1624 domain-containing protein n=1 Tax=Labedella endophytica TaxID=1523160 RepID=A0A3S0X8J3_9MICO|nr:heparan-alpha-glucosaminide N-acetyltransferase domain-containing protein [Labedella endophytica]RUR01894.1 DUF1624 domain-containing protein [Labedella endophytica]
MRAIADPSRVLGLDVARGLAVLGMFGAHLGAPDDLVLTDAGTWGAIVHGRSSILFAVLAGISVALLSGGRARFTDREDVADARARARVRIAVRALLIFLIGVMLTALGTNIIVILEYYAVMFLLAVPMIGLRARMLFALAGIGAIVSPVVVVLLSTVAGAYGVAEGNLLVDLFVTGGYPVIIWMSFLWFGMGLGRLDLGSTIVAVRLVVVGIGLALIGYGFGIATTDPNAADVRFSSPGSPDAIPEPDWSLLLGMEAHSGTSFEVVGSSGVAAVVIGLCLLAARRLRVVLFPVESIGATALSTYSIHVVAYALIFTEEPGPWAWPAFALTALVLCPLWRVLLGRGPIERVVTTMSTRAAFGPPVPQARASDIDPPVSDGEVRRR